MGHYLLIIYPDSVGATEFSDRKTYFELKRLHAGHETAAAETNNQISSGSLNERIHCTLAFTRAFLVDTDETYDDLDDLVGTWQRDEPSTAPLPNKTSWISTYVLRNLDSWMRSRAAR